MEEDESKPKSWEEVFEKNVIASTRSIEKQFRVDISHNKEKLRTLVGGSYRQLLATAEQIVSLESQTANTEQYISELSRSCKPPQYHQPVAKRPKESQVPQYSSLQKIISRVSISLKGGAVLPAAKLLTISRLLHKSLSSDALNAVLLDTLRQRIGSLRRQLLRKVDQKFRACQSTSTSLSQTVCAFCLATSSSVHDAVAYLHRLRLETIRHKITLAREHHHDVHQVFRYFVESLKVTKSFYSREVLMELRRSQTRPILQDADIQGIESLDLETLTQLLPAEIANFTPYIKQADQSDGEINGTMERWSADSFGVFIDGLQPILEEISDGRDIFELRKDLLLLWLPESFSTSAQPHVLDALRKAFNDRALALIEARAAEIRNLGKDVESLIRSAPSDTVQSDKLLWAEDLVTMPLGKGAVPFMRKLRSSQLGTTKALQNMLDSLHAWATEIEGLRNQIHDVRTIRWQDVITEADEDDEESLRAVVQELAHFDPDLYIRELESRLREAVTRFEHDVSRISREVQASQQHQAAVLLLRVVREISTCILASFPDTKLGNVFDTVPGLHRAVAEVVSQKLFETLQNRGKSSRAAVSAPDDLPSPAAFKFLHQLCKTMSEIGGADIWTPAAVIATKQAASRLVLDDENREHHVRNRFDEIYLRHALSEVPTVNGITEHDEVEKKAAEYWNRTKVLFGLLA